MKKFIVFVMLFLCIGLFAQVKKSDKIGKFITKKEFQTIVVLTKTTIELLDSVTGEIGMRERKFTENKNGDYFYVGDDRVKRKIVWKIKNDMVIAIIYGTDEAADGVECYKMEEDEPDVDFEKELDTPKIKA